MGKKSNIHSWKDCTHTDKVQHFAKQHNIRIEQGKGDHVKYVAPSGEFVVGMSKREISTGVAMQIFKFFLKLGLLAILPYLYFNCPTVIYDVLWKPMFGG